MFLREKTTESITVASGRILVPLAEYRTRGFCCAILLVPCSRAQRTQLRPGWNFYSPQDDIQLGKRVAMDAEKQLPSCNAPKVDAYLTRTWDEV